MRELLVNHRQFLIYLGGGLLSAAIDIGIMQLLIRGGCAYQLATTGGFASGLLFNYLFHLRLTFGAPASSSSFARYLCVVGLNYGVTMACVALAVLLLPAAEATRALAGKLASLPLVAFNGFLLGKYWIFKP